MMNPWLIRLIGVLLFAALFFGIGWRVKSAFVAERDLAIVEAKKEMIDAYRQEEGKAAEVLETKLASLRANERVIEREFTKIVDRPVYLNQCLDADGVRLIEAARAGQADSTEPAGKVR